MHWLRQLTLANASMIVSQMLLRKMDVVLSKLSYIKKKHQLFWRLYMRTPESTPRSLVTCLDKIWDIFVKCLRSARIKFGIFYQNATSETRIKIGSGGTGLRRVWIKIGIQSKNWTKAHYITTIVKLTTSLTPHLLNYALVVYFLAIVNKSNQKNFGNSIKSLNSRRIVVLELVCQ